MIRTMFPYLKICPLLVSHGIRSMANTILNERG